MTLWHPDTCGCEIEISDAQGTPEWGQAVRHVKICSEHQALGHDHKTVMAENQRKNIALADAAAAHPDVVFKWSFDKKRTLILEPASGALDAKAKNSLQSQLEAKHGAGKVVVN